MTPPEGGDGPYETGLDRNQANYTPLSPLSFLARAALVFPDRLAVIHGAHRTTWAQTYARCRRLASALAARGVGRHDTVAVMAPNVPAIYEAHFAVPMLGAVLNTLNIRLDAEAIAFQLRHGRARVLLTDTEFSDTIRRALALLDEKPLVIDIADAEGPGGGSLGETEYEAFLAAGDPGFAWTLPPDEWDAISLNYTSGTTGNPKGVVCHHRGAYLNAVSNALCCAMPQNPVYLWTLPMFHCNGWCFPWTLALQGGTNICLRKVEAGTVFALIREHRVSHMCGAPIVYSTLIEAPESLRAGITHAVNGLVAGAAPPMPMIEGAERMGFTITHVYGLTETYGPAAVCAMQPEWEGRSLAERVRLHARQGVAYPLQEAMAVLDPDTMQEVPHDGETIGEVMFRGNITMKGYLDNPNATAEAFAGGWFHSGDLAVAEPDGYVRIKDRAKDIIISGGENISSIEVEEVLYRHPAVETVAVVARPDERWGEVPCAFVELRPGMAATADELREFCRAGMARFKVPRAFVFGPIPKTATGKIPKVLLRERAKDAELAGESVANAR